jgi:APA family basic amino acid/polyamine antiporter
MSQPENTTSHPTPSHPHLERRLGLLSSTSIVVGTMIGTGIFFKAAIMTQTVGTPAYVLWAWVVAGALSLIGALAYAELGILFPQAGGDYVYLRHAYGELPAFLYGWQRFWIGSPGSIAAFGVGAASFAAELFNVNIIGGKPVVAILLIGIFTLLNCLTVRFSGILQSSMTILKVLMMMFLFGGLFFFSQGSFAHFHSESHQFPGWSAFSAAMLAALWAYDGWNNLPMVAGEIKHPSKNIPMALGFGMLIVIFIYGLMNVGYFFALPAHEIAGAYSKFNPQALPVATVAAKSFLGANGIWFLSLALVLSAIGAMNGSILTGARVPFAMAQDGLFAKALAKIHPRTHTPVIAVVVQGVWSCLLALSGTFDQLTDYVIFWAWVFYALTTASLFVFRRRLPAADRPYKAFGYPVIPAIFLVMAVVLLVNTFLSNPKDVLWGVLILLTGIPFYFWFRRTKTQA